MKCYDRLYHTLFGKRERHRPHFSGNLMHYLFLPTIKIIALLDEYFLRKPILNLNRVLLESRNSNRYFDIAFSQRFLNKKGKLRFSTILSRINQIWRSNFRCKYQLSNLDLNISSTTQRYLYLRLSINYSMIINGHLASYSKEQFNLSLHITQNQQ